MIRQKSPSSFPGLHSLINRSDTFFVLRDELIAKLNLIDPKHGNLQKILQMYPSICDEAITTQRLPDRMRG